MMSEGAEITEAEMTEAAVMTDVAQIIAEAGMNDVVVMIVGLGMTDVETLTEETGIVLNVTTQTLRSELNAIAVEKQKAKEIQDSSVTTAEAETTEVVMIDEVVMIVGPEMTDVAVITAGPEMTDVVMTEEITEVIMAIMIGNVRSVKTQTSHSEMNVTVVALLKADSVRHHPTNGKVMIAEQVKEEKNLSQELEIGIVHNVGNQILQREMIASVVAVQKELADLKIKVTTGN